MTITTEEEEFTRLARLWNEGVFSETFISAIRSVAAERDALKAKAFRVAVAYDALNTKNAQLRDALKNLLNYAERNECHHENTHRGGVIWTICDECGMKWADDKGGFKPYCEPVEITAARQALGDNP
jgi:hypothetical protein